MASEYEKYQQKLAAKKSLPAPTAKLDTEPKPAVDRAQPRKRH